jgi:hypothetical protein
MKKIFFNISVLIFLSNNIAMGQPLTSPAACSDLFISEITFGKQPKANGAFDLNYAIELFNASGSTVNLTDYSLELSNSAGLVTTVPLSGTLTSHDVHVVGNSNADINLQSLCDELSPDLLFDANVSLSLLHSGTPIDKIGIGGSSLPQSFDLALFMADPYNYLLNFHLDLNDYTNIDIRRSMLTTAGKPNFNFSTDVLGEWWYVSNVDRSDIGSYYGVCNKLSTDDIVGYDVPFSIVDYYGFNIDLMSLRVNGVIDGICGASGVQLLHSSEPTSTAVVCNDGSITVPETEFFGATFSVNSINTYCNDVEIVYPNNLANSGAELRATGPTVGNKHIDFKLTTTTSNVTISLANSTHRTYLTPSNLGVAQYSNRPLATLFPTRPNQTVFIKCSEPTKYSLYDCLGNCVKQGIAAGDFSIDVSQLSEGLSLIQLLNNSNKSTTLKFVK